MLIITPVAGSMAEPRPQYLVSGDRATKILDAASSAALQAAGVKLTTISLESFNKLITELVPETLDGLDADGKLTDAVMPSWATQAAIAALNLLDGATGDVAETYIPTRLSTSALTSMVNAQNSTVTETDPDGYPVIVGGASTTTDFTVSGNLTAGNFSAATGHADVFTANQATTTYAETSALATVNQSVEPGAPALGRVKVFTDVNGRLKAKDASANVFLIGNKRIVSVWPTAGASQLGDEAILSATGEHRVYLGAAKGWRLASPHTVSSLTERNALTNLYPGMKVYVDAGAMPQEHIYGSDSKWHGTKSYQLQLVGNYPVSGVNDSNWRILYTFDALDPGFPYKIGVKCGFELVAFNKYTRSFVQLNTSNYQNPGNGAVGMSYHFQDEHYGYADGVHRYDIASETQYLLEGSHSAQVYWRMDQPWGNAYTQNYWSYASARVYPE